MHKIVYMSFFGFCTLFFVFFLVYLNNGKNFPAMKDTKKVFKYISHIIITTWTGVGLFRKSNLRVTDYVGRDNSFLQGWPAFPTYFIVTRHILCLSVH